jgi:hypothetical protein
MDAYYTKAKPKVNDYNPITHGGFYNQPPSPFIPSRESPEKKLPWGTLAENPLKYPRSTSLAGKNIFSGSSTSRSPSGLDVSPGDSPRMYKTRPKNKVVDPISGEVKTYNIERPKIENLDLSYNRDKITNDFDADRIKRFAQIKAQLKSNDNIAGSLKKEVPFLPYVDPFILKARMNT